MADSNDVLDGLKVKNLGEDGFGCAEDDAQADAPLECGTLAIDNDDFMCDAVDDEECNGGIAEARGAEVESGENAHSEHGGESCVLGGAAADGLR